MNIYHHDAYFQVAAPVADEETIIDGDDDLDTTSQVNLRLPFSSLTDTSKTLSAGNGEVSDSILPILAVEYSKKNILTCLMESTIYWWLNAKDT